ncbi:hypothetical protein HF086_004358 [Spodoptera exigua]|uniref:Tetraspanin n=1 Tax=Spodoptera exigua TaxID=7107 RepID=A0A922SB12_SPOEX|nr:hypothetical protein HF086_004358 [Spodoptera exigua]
MSTPTLQDIQIEIGFNKMKSRRVRCMKFFITLFNIICILFGLILMAICVINMRDKKSQPEQQSALSRGVLSFLLTLGIALVVTAILGCVGALREHVRILYVHAGFFIFLVAVELVVGVGGAVLSAWMGGSSELRVQFYRNTTIEDETAKYHAFWDDLQSDILCIVLALWMARTIRSERRKLQANLQAHFES